ncbi:hypothetical protein Pcinc_004181 [Petrolisthes cinctipes]|uniref:Uncharacterized protein n=1 Tax=Petrolisthes cinctipes TaxID=88211 RepID=A0AAE1L1T3_PETCI|nr:hypothetical protein Pcinc_004181 [Petrolisthes cinctipes]
MLVIQVPSHLLPRLKTVIPRSCLHLHWPLNRQNYGQEQDVPEKDKPPASSSFPPATTTIKTEPDDDLTPSPVHTAAVTTFDPEPVSPAYTDSITEVDMEECEESVPRKFDISPTLIDP